MKILHITRQFYPAIGGVESVVKNLVRQQKKRGYQVDVLTLNKNFADGSPFKEYEEYEGTRIFRISFLGTKRYPIALSCLRYVKKYDILHIHCVDFFVDFLVFLKILHRKKIILHTHGGFFHTNNFLVFKKIYFYTITKLTILGCDLVIADSQNDFDLFRKVTKNLTKIENGIEFEFYSNITKRIVKGNFLFIGRIAPHKHIEKLIDMVAGLTEKGESVHLDIIGPDWESYSQNLRNRIDRLNLSDRIAFLGRVNRYDLANKLSQCHFFVSASEYEGFGISAVEAMASGTVCLLNDINSFRNFIRHDENGFILNFKDQKMTIDFVSKLIAMKREEYQKLANSAKEFAGKYSWSISANEVLKIYQKLLSGQVN